MKDIIRKLLTEELFDRSQGQVDLLNEFINFTCKFLKIDPISVVLKFNRDEIVTTASYGNNQIYIYVKDRAIVDIMRSIAHELTHLKQDVNDELDSASHEENNEAGSPIENEANAVAGELIRRFGKIHPEIYE